MSLVKSSIGVSLISLLVSIVSFCSQLLIANYFGATHNMDLYLAGTSIPFLVSALISSGLSYSLTPHLIKAKIDYKSLYPNYLGAILRSFSKYCILLFSIIGISNVFLFKLIYVTFSNDTYYLGIMVCAISWLVSFFSVIMGFMGCILNVEKKFKLPIILSFLPYIFIIISTFLFHTNYGILSILIGLLIGTILSILVGLFKLSKQISFGFISEQKKSSFKHYFTSLPSVVFAMLCFSIYQSIDSYWAPKLGVSNLSYLGYCQRIIVALGSLVIVGPSTVLVPRLAESISDGRINDFLLDIKTLLKVIISLSSLVVLIASMLAEDLIIILFERGQFTRQNTIVIASILPYMLIGMALMICVVMLFRAFFSRGIDRFVILIGISSSLIYFILSGIGAQLLGLVGIASAYLTTWLIIFIISLLYMYLGNLKLVFNKENLFFLFKQLVALIIVSLVIQSIKSLFVGFMIDRNFYNSLIVFGVTGFISVFIYLVIAIKVIPQYELITLFRKLGFKF
jgi:putative peptidoglycan lipid II flippase